MSFVILSISPGVLILIFPDAILNILNENFTWAPFRKRDSADNAINTDDAPVIISTGPGEFMDAFMDNSLLSTSNPEISL